MGDTKKYGQNAILALVDFDWSHLGDWYEVRSSGIWLIPPSSFHARFSTPAELEARIEHPTGDLDSPALPFPFTAEQFFAFCACCHTLTWDGIETIYSNDDNTLDENALADLARINKPSEELVRGLLSRKYGLTVSPSGQSGTPRKLSDQQRLSIKERLAKGEKVAHLAKEFGVDRRTIDKCKPEKKREPTLQTAWGRNLSR